MKSEIFSFRSKSLNSQPVFIKTAFFLILISVAGMMLTQNLMAEWSALGSGMNAPVYAIVSDSAGGIYAGGKFTTSGGVPTNHVAKWNGSSWIALGAGVSGQSISSYSYTMVYALAVDVSGNLYAGGDFTIADGVPVNYIAKWNGSSWSALGSGMNNTVKSLASDWSGNLYASGDFTTAGGISANCVAKWNGSSWSLLSSEIIYSSVKALATDSSGNLYVGGHSSSFSSLIFTGTSYSVTKWSGFSWNVLNYMSLLNSLTVDSLDNLYVSVLYSDTPRSRIDILSGLSWYTLGYDITGYAYALASDKSGSLYVGGDFISANFVSANYIAKWSSTPSSVFSVVFQAGTGGTINGSSSQSINQGGNCTTVKAVPNSGYHFVNWTGINGFITSTDNPLTVTNVTADMTITANFQPVGDSKVIIVAGGGNYLSNMLWEGTKRNTDFAYDALIFQGYKPENIYYLSEDNGFSTLINGTASKQNLGYAITSWAKDADNLLIYMADHGGDGTFRMSETEILYASELAGWLDTIQQTIPGNVILVYDACRSGSFVRHLKGQRRILLTSASDGENAIFASDGTLSFSWLFWSQIYSGRKFYDAFANSKSSMNLVGNSQHSLIDADGDGVANSKTDTEIASGISIGDQKASADDFPTIGSVSPAKSLTDTTSALIYADNVIDTEGIKRVWAVITPPNYISYSADTPVISLPTMELKSVGNNRYEATYDRFIAKGSYKIVIFATDNKDFTSLPEEKHITSVTQTQGNSCVFVNNDLDLNVCAIYQGVRYGFTMKFDDTAQLSWKMDVGTFRELQNDPGNCIAVGNGLKLDMCVEYQGKDYGFTMNYDKDLIWKMDVGTFKTIN